VTDQNGSSNGQVRSEDKVRVAIIGVGNCANSLLQGVEYYKDAADDQFVPGLMHVNLGGYHVRDVEFVAAFDVVDGKVGKDLSEAIWAKPNDTIKFADVPKTGVTVSRGMTHDGLGKYLSQIVEKARLRGGPNRRVDRFGHFGVAFTDSLCGLARHHRDRAPPVRRHQLGGPAQQCPSLGRGRGRPSRTGVDRTRHDRVDLVGERRRQPHRDAERREAARQPGRVRVRHVARDELVPDREDRCRWSHSSMVRPAAKASRKRRSWVTRITVPS